MNLAIPVVASLVYQWGLVQIVIKKVGAVEGSRTRKLVWQYFFAMMIALITGAITRKLEISWAFVVVAIIGAASAFGCYCHWRAYDISMSRTAMLGNLDDFIAVGLGYSFLGELNVLTPVLTAGIAVSAICATAFTRLKQPASAGKAGLSRQLVVWVLGYSAIGGIALFAMRAYALQGMTIPTFAAAWYFGAFFGALFTRFVIMGADEAGPPLTRLQQGKVLLLAVAIWTSLMSCYWLRQLFPVTVIQPIDLVAEMSIPAVIGLIFFREIRTMSRKEIYLILGGLIGVALIAIGFR